MKGGDIRDQFGVNQWMEQKKVITSLDLAKRKTSCPDCGRSTGTWSSWTRPTGCPGRRRARKTAATPWASCCATQRPHPDAHGHTPQGRPENFSLFLQLLDRTPMRTSVDPRGDGTPPRAVLSAPHQGGDGLLPGTPRGRRPGRPRRSSPSAFRTPWTSRSTVPSSSFTGRDPLREAPERPAARPGRRPRARAVGFLMSLYQRRLASSTHAMRRSLENRARRLEEGLKRARSWPGWRRRISPIRKSWRKWRKRARAAGGDARGHHAGRQRRAGARGDRRAASLAARPVGRRGLRAEAKLSKLKELLQKEGFFDDPDQRLLSSPSSRTRWTTWSSAARAGASGSAASTAA
jgi:hypothetical protein